METRDTARQTVEKNMNKALQLIEDIDKSTTAQNDFPEIFALRDTLVEKFDKIKTLDENIFNILIDQDKGQEELDAEDENASNFSIHFKAEIFKVNKFIDQFQKQEPGSNKSDNSNNSSKLIKLPNINLKGSDGEPENWQTFYDNFECAIHHNNDLSDIKNMTYLKNLVEGQASNIIAGLKLWHENYVISLNLLKERYNDKQLQIYSHMQKLN